MATTVVPLPSCSPARQIQTLVASGVSVRHHSQQWRIRASAAASTRPASGTLLRSSHWRRRVSAQSAESVDENVQVATAPTAETGEQEAHTGEPEAAQAKEGDAAEAQTEAPKTIESESLIMMLKAEGSVPEESIPIVRSTLEEMEDVSDVQIYSFEGLTSISFTKKTVIQATNVASELVDAIENAGFRMHTLELAIDDKEDNRVV